MLSNKRLHRTIAQKQHKSIYSNVEAIVVIHMRSLKLQSIDTFGSMCIFRISKNFLQVKSQVICFSWESFIRVAGWRDGNKFPKFSTLLFSLANSNCLTEFKLSFLHHF